MFSGIFISEVVHKSNRKLFGVFPSMFMSVGCLFTSLGGYLNDDDSWRSVAWAVAALPLLPLLPLLVLWESPFWLVEQGRTDEAK